MANIVIDIAAEFTGNKAFKKAETATSQLSNSASKLGKAFIGLYSTQKLLAYGKASLQAAADDEKAQKQLALALKNVGLGRDVATTEEYIQKLQSEFGVLDDKLRPAYQTLAVATQDSAESQKLLQLALDISASTGKDLSSVTAALSKAYLGNNTALSKLGVGISKADLKTKSFKNITDQLATTFAGSATQSANTFQGSMDKLAVASNNAKEIIGEGLIDALKNLGDAKDVEKLSTDMENTAESIADVIRGLGVMIGYIKDIYSYGEDIPFLKKIRDFVLNLNAITRALKALQVWGDKAEQAANATADSAQALSHLAELQSKYSSKSLDKSKKLTAEELKQLNAKRLQLAIDKANLALGKGDDVFNLEKIQLAAAEKNAAEQLGKVTNSAQLLQITNDLARLNVKQSILALEDAIASKDIKAIEAGTAKLNKDLAILGALTNQEVKLRDIESILKDIVPKDLINIANLDEAIAKLKSIGDTKIIVPLGKPTPSDTSNKPLTPSQVEDLLILGKTVPIVPDSSGTIGYSGNAGNYASSGFPGSAMGYGNTNTGNTIIVNTGIGDPNAIAEAIDLVLQNAKDRGTLRVAV